MKTVSAFLLVILCSLTALGSAQKTGTIKGKIESVKGKPIAGAEVRATRNRDR